MKRIHMRKTPLTLAVAATLALACNSASALEAELYGVGHVSADSNDDGTNSSTYIASNSSRLGVKGDHDLGNGLKIVFQFESGVDLTGRGTNDGNGPGTADNLFSTARDSFAGIGGNFGTVVAGRLGVLNQWLYDYNLFADQVGDLGNIWGGTGIPGRANGVIAYLTPKIADSVDGLVAYVPDSGTDNSASVLVKVNFARSGLKLGGAYLNMGKGTNAADFKSYAITGSYSFKQFSVGGGYQQDTDYGFTSGNKRKSYTVGASADLAGGTLKAQYTNSSDDAPNADATMVAVGYDYHLRKDTTVYVAYSSTDNDANAAFTANNWGHGQAVTPAAGQDPSSISLGVVYKFGIGL